MKSSILHRSLAYIIDAIIIGLLVSVLCSVLPTNESISVTEITSLQNQLIEGKITPDRYIEEYKDILYQNNKDNKIETIINIILIIGYFVVFQYTNNGQTLGKKLFKIRVVDKDTNKPPTIIKGFVRTLIILNIVSNIVNVTLINYLNKTLYISTYLKVMEVESLLVLISFIFIAFRKDGRGLHDLITNTKVIEER